MRQKGAIEDAQGAKFQTLTKADWAFWLLWGAGDINCPQRRQSSRTLIINRAGLTKEHSRAKNSAPTGSMPPKTGVSSRFFPCCSIRRAPASRIIAVAEPPGRPIHCQRKCGHGGFVCDRDRPEGYSGFGTRQRRLSGLRGRNSPQIEYFSREDIPVTVGLVIDNSGTMGPKRTEVIVSSLAFARSSNPEDQMFVVNFNENVSFGLPDNMPFTDKMDQWSCTV